MEPPVIRTNVKLFGHRARRHGTRFRRFLLARVANCSPSGHAACGYMQSHSTKENQSMSRKSALSVVVASVFLAGLGGCATDRTATEQNQTMTERTEDGWI